MSNIVIFQEVWHVGDAEAGHGGTSHRFHVVEVDIQFDTGMPLEKCRHDRQQKVITHVWRTDPQAPRGWLDLSSNNVRLRRDRPESGGSAVKKRAVLGW